MPIPLHRRLHRVADQAARLCGFMARRERIEAGELTVLMYHRVLPDERCANYPLASLAMPLSAFREQINWLAAHGEVLPLVQALARIRDSAPSTRPLFAVTVDDGYSDAAEFAATALEAASARGTFFVTTGFVEMGELLWFDRAALLVQRLTERQLREIALGIRSADDVHGIATTHWRTASWITFLKCCQPAERRSILAALEDAVGDAPSRAGYEAMSVPQVAELHARGHEIGSHTVTHAILPDLDDDTLRSEIEGARDALAGWLGGEVPGFCYPNGDCDERVARAVSRAGHRYACTTRDGRHHGSQDPYWIRRVDIVPDRVLDHRRCFDATAFRRELCGLYRRRDPSRLPGEHR
jgi:peptidoglycan/xylan/chitin deacetylase (PgdA/CDA1 family)